jgi:hypothetical protein
MPVLHHDFDGRSRPIWVRLGDRIGEVAAHVEPQRRDAGKRGRAVPGLADDDDVWLGLQFADAAADDLMIIEQENADLASRRRADRRRLGAACGRAAPSRWVAPSGWIVAAPSGVGSVPLPGYR